MSKYVYLYTGGGMAETPEAQEQVMQAWTAWFTELGPAIVEPGNPFGASASVASDGSVGGSTAGVGGFTVISADSLDAATALAKGCPQLTAGGTVEIFEALEM
jgi:hypothetical protein